MLPFFYEEALKFFDKYFNPFFIAYVGQTCSYKDFKTTCKMSKNCCT